MSESQSPSTIGKYQIIGVLGRGSMGVVYKAVDPEIGRTVAVKTLRKLPTAPGNDTKAMLDRFKLEARSAGSLRHPNLITVFEVSSIDDTPFIVMDFIEGEGLDGILQRAGKLSPQQAIGFLAQAARGIDHAHARGVIHRDIKPGNLLVDKSGAVYVVDFGVAAMTSNPLFASNAVVGTPSYMSPEQILNEQLDHRVDLWALAVVSFEFFTGVRPFQGDNFTAVVGNVLNGTRLMLSEKNPELPLALEAEFDRAFDRELKKRFPSATEMINSFARALGINPLSDGGSDQMLPVQKKKKSSEWRTFRKRKIVANEDLPVPSARLSAWEQKEPKEPAIERQVSLARVVAEGESSQSFSVADAIRHNARRGALHYITLSLGAACILLSVVIFTQVFTAERPGRERPAVSETTVAPGTTAGNAAHTAPEELGPPEVDPVPLGKNLHEMTNREVLGVLVSSGVPEQLVVDALHEAEGRRVASLAQALVLLIKSDSSVIRQEVARIAGDTRDRRLVPYLLPMLDDHDPFVRRATATAIGKLGDRAALGYLSARLMTEDSPSTKRAIEKAIELITGVPVR